MWMDLWPCPRMIYSIPFPCRCMWIFGGSSLSHPNYTIKGKHTETFVAEAAQLQLFGWSLAPEPWQPRELTLPRCVCDGPRPRRRTGALPGIYGGAGCRVSPPGTECAGCSWPGGEATDLCCSLLLGDTDLPTPPSSPPPTRLSFPLDSFPRPCFSSPRKEEAAVSAPW